MEWLAKSGDGGGLQETPIADCVAWRRPTTRFSRLLPRLALLASVAAAELDAVKHVKRRTGG